MEHLPEASRDGQYDAYLHSDGKTYLVLEGLNASDTHEPGAVENFVHARYDQITFAYWAIFALTFAYLITVHLILPLKDKLINTVWRPMRENWKS